MTHKQGDPVQCHVDLGHVLGKRWFYGYAFERYENEHTCLVRILDGFSEGSIVRYNISDVRPEPKKGRRA